MNALTKAKSLIQQALATIGNQLTHPTDSAMKAVSPEQILHIQHSLEAMLSTVERGDWETAGARRHGLGRVIADSWPLHSDLGSSILSAEQAYLALIEERPS